MRFLTTGALSLFAVSLLAFAILAQPPGGPQGMRGGRGGGPGRGGAQGQQTGYQPPVNLLIMALNANGDSEISAAEIKNAAASLKKLDRNNDGKLTIDEVMPAGPPPVWSIRPRRTTWRSRSSRFWRPRPRRPWSWRFWWSGPRRTRWSWRTGRARPAPCRPVDETRCRQGR